MKQKLFTMLLAAVLVFFVSGCAHIEESISVSSDNKITVSTKQCYQKDATDELMQEMIESDETGAIRETWETYKAMFDIETIDGVDYYVEEQSVTSTVEEYAKENPEMIVTKDKFYLYAELDAEDLNTDVSETIPEMDDYIEYISLKVTLPSPIVKTNGTQEENDQTASWLVEVNPTDSYYEMYAYTANDAGNVDADRATVQEQIKEAMATPTPRPTSNIPQISTSGVNPNITSSSPAPSKSKDKKAPVIKGVKKNKSYKKKATVYVKDNVKIKKVTVNGKKVSLKKVKSGKYKGYYKFTVKKKGKNKIIAIDTSGNKKKMTIKIKK